MLTRYSAEYYSFWITDEADSYRINLDSHSGDAADGLIVSHQGMPFSTVDKNSSPGGDCPGTFGGGWWYSSCGRVVLTHQNYGVYTPLASYGITSPCALQTSRMMVKPKDY